MIPAQDILRRARAARYAAGGGVDPTAVQLTAKPLYDKYAMEAMTNGEAPLTYDDWVMQQQQAQAGGLGPATAQPPAVAQPVPPGLLQKLRSMIMGRAAGGPVSGAGMLGPAPAGDSANRLDALRQMLGQMQGGGAPQMHYADGGAVHHVDPYTEGGFSHETGDGEYMYADGGPILPPGGMGAPHLPMGMPPPPGVGAPPPGVGPAAPIGALAQMGQQLMQQQQGLAQAYNIPAGAPAPMSTAGGPPPSGGVGLPSPGGGGAPGGAPPSPQILAALQAKLGPRHLAEGGPVGGIGDLGLDHLPRRIGPGLVDLLIKKLYPSPSNPTPPVEKKAAGGPISAPSPQILAALQAKLGPRRLAAGGSVDTQFGTGEPLTPEEYAEWVKWVQRQPKRPGLGPTPSPRLAAGGPISGGMMKMALRNPGVMRKYCMGGKM